MFFYILLLSIVFFLGICTEKSKFQKSTCAILSLLIVIPPILRDSSVGYDTKQYINFYGDISRLKWDELYSFYWEIGFTILNKALAFVKNGYTISIFVAVLFSLSFYYYIKVNSRIFWLSFYLLIALGFYGWSFNILRQICALLVFITLGIHYIQEKKLVKYILTVLLAALFHKTALICLPVYWLCKIKITRKNFYIAVVCILAAAKYSGKFIDAIVYQYFEKYAAASNENGSYLLFFMYFAIFAIGFAFRKQWKEDVRTCISYNMLGYSLLLTGMAQSFPLLGRIALFGQIAVIIFVPNFIWSFKNVKNRKILVIGTMAISFLYYFIILSKNANGIVPYKSFFSF